MNSGNQPNTNPPQQNIQKYLWSTGDKVLASIAYIFLALIYILTIANLIDQPPAFLNHSVTKRSIDSGGLFGMSLFTSFLSLPSIIIFLTLFKKHQKFSIIGIVLLILLLLPIYILTFIS